VSFWSSCVSIGFLGVQNEWVLCGVEDVKARYSVGSVISSSPVSRRRDPGG